MRTLRKSFSKQELMAFLPHLLLRLWLCICISFLSTFVQDRETEKGQFNAYNVHENGDTCVLIWIFTNVYFLWIYINYICLYLHLKYYNFKFRRMSYTKCKVVCFTHWFAYLYQGFSLSCAICAAPTAVRTLLLNTFRVGRKGRRTKNKVVGQLLRELWYFQQTRARLSQTVGMI